MADPSAPFEGPEKLLEIWFAPSPALCPDAAAPDGQRFGLRKVPRAVWEDMLAIVKCQVLSVVEGEDMDAYLLSESSFFVSPHRLILKTCGTTLNLLGLPRILDIARTQANMPIVHRLFYSRKSFMFPERQHGPHREWKDEVRFLDEIFENGAAYTVGKVNGDHWLLYMTGPAGPSSPSLRLPGLPTPESSVCGDLDESALASLPPAVQSAQPPSVDYTIEILMTHLGADARAPFFTPPHIGDGDASSYGRELSATLGISDLFPRERTTLDAYAFTPCGYSSNALLRVGDKSDGHAGEGYYTIHVTPEEGWSYASFECNVPLPPRVPSGSTPADAIPDLQTLVRRVVRIFQPGKITLTLFVSSADNTTAEDQTGDSAVEDAQRAFVSALTRPLPPQDGAESGQKGSVYARTDKINYEFGGYDLAFASFELRA